MTIGRRDICAAVLASVIILQVTTFSMIQAGAQSSPVTIDIMPNNSSNNVSCISTTGSIKVVIFTDSSFAARYIAVSTLKLEDKQVTAVYGRIYVQDVDRDRDYDAVVYLKKASVCSALANLPAGELVPVKLTGALKNGQQFEGTDTVRVDFGSQTTPTTPTTPPTQPTQATELELEVHKLVNEERVKAGLQPLQWSEQLAGVARQHSSDMMQNNFFDHRNFSTRIRTVCGGWAGENIFMASGMNSADIAQKAVSAWMNSAGHKANILRTTFYSEGVGIAISDSKAYVTQDFCQ